MDVIEKVEELLDEFTPEKACDICETMIQVAELSSPMEVKFWQDVKDQIEIIWN